MLENSPSQPNSDPDRFDPAQAALHWMQQQLLAEQGITVSPEEALNLFEQKILFGIKRGIQQDLAEHGIDASPDEADAIDRLQFYHDLMKPFGPTGPHETP
jgi:hypothetical protein